VDLPGERASLRRAEAFFRRSLDIDPAFVEARLRLGRVIGLLGRHQEAASELRRCAEAATGQTLQYYAALFLGAEEESLGHFDLARDAFQRASAAWPSAQSPHLALSQLARRIGNRAGAIQAIQAMFSLPSVEEDRSDPWWAYFEEPAGTAKTLVDEVRAVLFLADR
jgi:tetratricopeptide (TPR) repeat protein